MKLPNPAIISPTSLSELQTSNGFERFNLRGKASLPLSLLITSLTASVLVTVITDKLSYS